MLLNHIRYLGLFVLLGLQVTACQSTVPDSNRVHLEFSENSVTHYAILDPSGITESSPRALIVLLHGRGSNPRKYLQNWQEAALNYPFVYLVPDWQRPKTEDQRGGVNLLFPLIEETAQKYGVPPTQIYLVGLSAGGAVAHWMIDDAPEKWAGVAMMAFSPKSHWDALEFESLPPIKVFVGEEDSQVDIADARRMSVKALIKGHDIETQIFSGFGHIQHEDWAEEILDWINVEARKV